MTIKTLIYKVRRRIWDNIVLFTYKKTFYPLLYRSYWHFLFTKKSKKNTAIQYFSAYPNSGAGIGHQMANWISGYWWARQFELNYAYIPFPNQSWESFFGFDNNEVKVEDLLKHGYKTVLLPFYLEKNPNRILLIKKIIQSYANQKIIFIAEQDQGFKNHYEIMGVLKQKFYNAPSRKNDILTYSDAYLI